jgi:hypothetical protein
MKGMRALQQKDRYNLEELFEELPCTLVALGDKSGLNEVTVARIRDGKPARRSTVNSLLRAFSDIYGISLTLHNVTGINVQVNKRIERKAEKTKV